MTIVRLAVCVLGLMCFASCESVSVTSDARRSDASPHTIDTSSPDEPDEVVSVSSERTGVAEERPNPHVFDAVRIVWHPGTSNEAAPGNVQSLSTVLTRLHKSTLATFLSQPSFGWRRMPQKLTGYGPSGQPIMETDWDAVKRQNPHSHPAVAMFARANWQWLTELQGLNSHGFVYRADADGQVARSSIDSGLHEPGTQRLVVGYPGRPVESAGLSNLPTLEQDSDVWRLSSMALIGLWKWPKPMIYEVHRKAASRARRETTAVEQDAIAAFRRGAQLYGGYDSGTGSVRFLGTIRARKHCLECHEDQEEGALLGAFSYHVVNLPRATR